MTVMNLPRPTPLGQPSRSSTEVSGNWSQSGQDGVHPSFEGSFSAESIGREPGEAYTPSGSGEADPLLRAFNQVPTPSRTTEVKLLHQNAEAWNERWKLLEQADDSISMTSFQWSRDVFGKALLGHIFHRAREGVQARVMVDGFGDALGLGGFKAHWGGKDYLQELAAVPGAEAKVYHPLHRKLSTFLKAPTGLDGLAANHDKILEVDGQQAIVGGRNIKSSYFSQVEDDPKAWRDVEVRLNGGETAADVKRAFDEEFEHPGATHRVKPDRFGNLVKRDVELLGAYAMMDAFLKNEGQPWDSKEVLEQGLSRLPDLGLEREPSRRELKALTKLAQDLAEHQHLQGTYFLDQGKELEAEVKIIDRTSPAGSGLDQMNSSFLSLVEGAQESIVLQSPYMVLTDPMLDALQAAGERGVAIEIDTNTPSNAKSTATHVFFLNDWDKVVATTENLTVRGATGQRHFHGKVGVIDDRVSVVGSYNLDQLSSESSGEVAAVVYSEEFAQKLKDGMQSDRDDPMVGFQEYRIARDELGAPIGQDGQSILDDQGRVVDDPVVLFGPEHHMDPKSIKFYERGVKVANLARKILPQFAQLRRHVG